MSGNSPTTANSVVPMAKVARKSAKSKGDMGRSSSRDRDGWRLRQRAGGHPSRLRPPLNKTRLARGVQLRPLYAAALIEAPTFSMISPI